MDYSRNYSNRIALWIGLFIDVIHVIRLNPIGNYELNKARYYLRNNVNFKIYSPPKNASTTFLLIGTW